jgi:hypothetical protein
MIRSVSRLVLSCAAVAAVSFSSAAWAMHGGEGLKWGDGPEVLPKGAKLAVLQGDPMKPGPYVLRLQFPAGYKIAPHSHSKDENVTVMSGTLMLGMGDKPDMKAMKTIKPGEYGSIPAKQNHYAMAKTAAIIQIHGDGPFDISYVNADDDPAKMTSKPAAKQAKK